MTAVQQHQQLTVFPEFIAKIHQDIAYLVVPDMLLPLIIMSVFHPGIIRDDRFIQAVYLFGILVIDLLPMT